MFGGRDAFQAQIRNLVRVVLRKYGSQQGLLELVAEQMLALEKLTDRGDST